MELLVSVQGPQSAIRKPQLGNPQEQKGGKDAVSKSDFVYTIQDAMHPVHKMTLQHGFMRTNWRSVPGYGLMKFGSVVGEFFWYVVIRWRHTETTACGNSLNSMRIMTYSTFTQAAAPVWREYWPL